MRPRLNRDRLRSGNRSEQHGFFRRSRMKKSRRPDHCGERGPCIALIDQPVPAEPCPDHESSRRRSPLLDQKDRVEPAPRVVERDDQIKRARTTSFSGREPSWNSIIPGNAGRRRLSRGRHAARSTPARSSALRFSRCNPGKNEKTALGQQRLVKMLYCEVPVAGPILLHHEFDPVHRRPPPRGPLSPPIDQALRPGPGRSAGGNAAR